MNAVALTPEQHRYLLPALTEALRHLLETRDLEAARADGRLSRRVLEDLRQSARLDAAKIARTALADLPDAALLTAAARVGRRTLDDLLRAVKAADSQPASASEDYLDSSVTPWVRIPR